MFRRPNRLLLIESAALLAVFALTAAIASAADLIQPVSPMKTGNEQALEDALDDDTHFEFIQMPLSDVVAYLEDLHKAGIRLDKKSLEAAGIGSDTSVSCMLKGVSLRSGLRLLLDDQNLTYCISDETILITTREGAEKRAAVRVYDVSPLLAEGDSAGELARVLVATLAGRKLGAAQKPAEAINGDKNGKPATAVKPARSISSFRHMLIVRDTTLGHREVAEVLTSLREGLAP